MGCQAAYRAGHSVLSCLTEEAAEPADDQSLTLQSELQLLSSRTLQERCLTHVLTSLCPRLGVCSESFYCRLLARQKRHTAVQSDRGGGRGRRVPRCDMAEG